MAALATASQVGVIGAGAMGAGIAEVAALAGHRVHLFDARMGAADTAKLLIADGLRKRVARGKVEAEKAEAAIGRLVPVHALGDMVSAALVVEAIVEDLEVKRKLFRELEVVVAADAVLATNTSSLSITAIAAGMKHPGRMVGMHFFNPAPVLPLVEVVSGLATDPGVAERIYGTAKAWGKVPVHAASTPGFIVNRCARPFYGEGLRIAAEGGASYATIDAVMREAGGFRMGPFELMDLIGLDVNYAVTRSVWEAYYQDARYAPSILQRELVAAGFFGRKTGRGFYDYTATAPRVAPQTEAAQPRPAGVRLAGESAATLALAARLRAHGVEVASVAADPRIGTSCLLVGDACVALTDGRTATALSAASGQRDCVVFDLALDHAACARIAAARSDTCSDAAWAAAAGMFQAADIAVSRVDDVAGLVVMRTVAMLANESADAVTQGIATARDIDLAMCNGVNYPRGPLAWADAIGVRELATVLRNLHAHYGDPRYRTSPLVTRRALAGEPLGAAG